MEVKKHPTKDFCLIRNNFFLVALLISISSVSTAFKGKQVASTVSSKNCSTTIVNPLPLTSIINEVEHRDESDTLFLTVKQQPEPANGFPSFYQHLSKNLKYPKQAKKMGTEGKVLIEFIVNKNGELSDLKLIRGIGSGCDDEAMRVLAMTKWEPGKQRGQPVRVKMIMPIYFMLSK